MAYIVGTDEAGYGPNLGPLVVSASVWEVPGESIDVDLYSLLSGAVRREHSAAGDFDGSLAIADSKSLHTPGQGLAALERGVLAMLAVSGRPTATWRAAWEALQAATPDELAALPWHENYDEGLPIDAARDELTRDVRQVVGGMSHAGVRLVALKSRAVFPDRWNALNDVESSKGAVLSQITLDLAAEMLAGLPQAPTLLVCDKHGGRSRYAELLYGRLTDAWIEVREESLERSVYRWRREDAAIEAHFCARGEAQLPVALASMASKYLRELSMRAFNAWWGDRVPGLKPTAGYPVDARRFRRDIAQAQRALGVDDRVLWRNK